MRKGILVIVLCLAVAVGAYTSGKFWGSIETSEKHLKKEMDRWDQLSSLDKSLLPTFPARSNSMTSGTYLMQIWFPTWTLGTQQVVLKCENGQITVPAPNTFYRSGSAGTLSTTGNVVSWTQEGVLYEGNAKYVGIIDGDEMWGRVYGWGPSDQSVGLWRIYPKPGGQDSTNAAAQ